MIQIFLKSIREQKNITIIELAKKAKCSTSTIWDIENQKIDPKLSTLCRIAKALEISIDNELFKCE